MPKTKSVPSTVKRSSAKARRTWEKVGDEWKAKRRRGPSAPRAPRGVGETFGGVDYYGHNKVDLYERARRLGIEGRSRMSKRELARAIARAH